MIFDQEPAPSTAAPSPVEVTIGAVGLDSVTFRRLTDALGAAGLGARIRTSSMADLPRLSGELEVAVLLETSERGAIVEQIRQLRDGLFEAAIIVICDENCGLNSRRVLRAGADAVVDVTQLERTIAAAIHAIRCGQTCVADRLRGPLEEESLSMREKQVLGMVVMGFANSEIAAKLYLAESTVKSHLSSAYRKLGVRSRKDAASIILDPTEGFGPGILAISAA